MEVVRYGAGGIPMDKQPNKVKPVEKTDDMPESGRSLNFVYERTGGGTHRILAKIM